MTNRVWIGALLAVLLASCGRHPSETGGVTNPSASAAPARTTRAEVVTAAAMLASTEQGRINDALELLKPLAQGGFSAAEQAYLVARYPDFPPAGRLAALQALSNDMNAAGKGLGLSLLRKHGWVQAAFGDASGYFGQECRAPAHVLESLVDDSIAGLPASVRQEVLLACANANRLSPTLAERGAPLTLARLTTLLTGLEPAQHGHGVAWRWEEGYADLRFEADVIADLLGHMPKSAASVRALRRTEALRDPLLKLWSSISLLRLGEQPASDSMKSTAGDPETRNLLLDHLDELKRRDLFPKSELTQAKLAESNMVSWLAFPTELGRAPDHIELMKVIEQDAGPDGGGVFAYYIFRFRNDPPDERAAQGWLAGVAGPFRKLEAPSTRAWGDTFSTFAAWDDFKPEEHLSSIQELMKSWRDHAQDAP
jgi:hypothetical protein